MSAGSQPLPGLDVQPLTPGRWPDLEALFGPHGACAGCWCMYWRVPRAESARQKGEGNRQALRALVDAGQVPGLLAYADGRAIAWCAVGPREAFPTLERSRTLRRLDEQPVWSVVCFYVQRKLRRRGILVSLLRAAVAYAGQQGAAIVEGYPVEATGRLSPVSGYMGLASTFQAAGFLEVARLGQSRPLMRHFIGGEKALHEL